MSLTITTIVCAYNEARLLPACLYSLLAQTRPPDDILVINNASTDETGAVARAVPGVRVDRRARKGLVVARETARRAAHTGHRRLRRRRLPRADHLAGAGRSATSRARRPCGGHRPLPVLRLGLERPRAHPGVRPPRGPADPRRSASCVRRSARFSTAETSRFDATRWPRSAGSTGGSNFTAKTPILGGG